MNSSPSLPKAKSFHSVCWIIYPRLNPAHTRASPSNCTNPKQIPAKLQLAAVGFLSAGNWGKSHHCQLWFISKCGLSPSAVTKTKTSFFFPLLLGISMQWADTDIAGTALRGHPMEVCMWAHKAGQTARGSVGVQAINLSIRRSKNTILFHPLERKKKRQGHWTNPLFYHKNTWHENSKGGTEGFPTSSFHPIRKEGGFKSIFLPLRIASAGLSQSTEASSKKIFHFYKEISKLLWKSSCKVHHYLKGINSGKIPFWRKAILKYQFVLSNTNLPLKK